MCLRYEKKLTEQKLNYFKQNKIKEIIVWKVLKVIPSMGYYFGYNKILYSYIAIFYGKFSYKKGKNIPDKILKRFNLNAQDKLIENGVLHCYQNRKAARYQIKQLSKHPYLCNFRYRVMRCKIKVQDIVAYGNNNDIAVKALYIDKFSDRK